MRSKPIIQSGAKLIAKLGEASFWEVGGEIRRQSPGKIIKVPRRKKLKSKDPDKRGE